MSNENIENIVTWLDKTWLDNNQMTQSTDSSKHRETYELGINLDPEPSSSDSPESSSSDSRARKKKRTKKKKRRKHQKDDSSDPSSSDDSDSSDDIHYRRKWRKQHKHKKHRKKDPIRICATLTEKLLTTAYKSKIIRFKMNEDPLQRRIYFLTFTDSLDMIFHSTGKIVNFL